MRDTLFRTVAVIALALPLASGFTPVPGFDTDAAHAERGGNGNGNGGNGNGNGGNGNGNGNGGSANGNGGNGNGNGNGNGHAGGNGHGAIASELRNANAANANINAMLNAAPDSNVGQLNTLRERMSETAEAYEAWQDAYRDYVEFRDAFDGRTAGEIEAEIAELDEEPETYEADLERLEGELAALAGYEEELGRLAGLSNDAAGIYEEAEGLEGDALAVVTRGRDLSDEALAELRRRLVN
ncbi:hypothetical protein N8I71_19295 [Roseibacterium sp. SDUM158016]|uniref:hypothetical protein n=1 Tax=Roseicyclus sediminis TaxID=2980997 RepID=UPI0021CF9DEC|nr:hypothetical protein [Roseibacterium sp. SDUM158016]MCU4654991.1 hypothetical protein [Roseibacterium sp. SDUM158016]